ALPKARTLGRRTSRVRADLLQPAKRGSGRPRWSTNWRAMVARAGGGEPASTQRGRRRGGDLRPGREGDGEEGRRAAAHPALEPDPPAVRLDDELDDREPQPGRSAPGLMGLPDPIEAVGAILGRGR